MRSNLDTQLATFLRKRRGESTYAEFSRKLGISASTLYRLENCEQSATLQRLGQILDRLRCSLADIFSKDCK